ncbi:MAG: prenyltransferase [Myxococcota bacterium]|nr:prenyltransferase [Myxococcota bacterium]
MTRFGAWIKASRLPSQSYIFLPLLMGQGLAVAAGQALDWFIFGLVQCSGLFLQLYIVYANDYADAETDRLNQTYTVFSGGSRVLVDGDLGRASLGRAAIAMALLALGCGAGVFGLAGRWLPLVGIAVGLGLLWMYSYPPIKLSYRGGGELLQMIGVGLILPLIGYFAQGGLLQTLPWCWVLAVLPAQLASAIATSLPDAVSDGQSNKNTLCVWLGTAWAQGAVLALNVSATVAVWVCFRLLSPTLGAVPSLSPSALAVVLAAGLVLSRRAARGMGLSALVAVSVFVPLYLTGLLTYTAFVGDLVQ